MRARDKERVRVRAMNINTPQRSFGYLIDVSVQAIAPMLDRTHADLSRGFITHTDLIRVLVLVLVLVAVRVKIRVRVCTAAPMSAGASPV